MTDGEAMALEERDEARKARDAWADALDDAHRLIERLEAEVKEARATIAMLSEEAELRAEAE
jgi:hypothetical protein